MISATIFRLVKRHASAANVVSALALTAGLASQAHAATATANLTVQANVLAACSVSAGTLDFGDYSGVQKDAQTDLSVTCSNQTNYSVALGGGNNQSGAQRAMKGGAGGTLSYSLYADNGRTQIVNINSNIISQMGNGQAQTVTVYGRVPANQAPKAEAYTDTVLVTVTF